MTSPIKRPSRAVTRLCVVTPYPPAPSETFIQGHVTGLPASTVLVHGWRPTVGDRPVLSLPSRVAYKAWRMLRGNGIQPEATAAYVKAFKHHAAHVVLAEYGPTGVRTMAACRQLGIPLIVHFHGFDASVRSVLEHHAHTYPAMFRDAAAIVAVSQAMRSSLIALGAPAAKVHYNPCGVDCRQFGGARPAEAPPVFVAVGRFVEKKAPQLTLRAFAEVVRSHASARLHMIGDGPLLDGCRQLAAQLGIEGAVTFLGTQPPAVVQEEMRKARGFVQHSIEAENGDREGTPVGILEAGASGLPVVATHHGGIPDVVVSGETGFLVAEKDVAAMARHMLALAESPALAGRLGRQARDRIAAHFSNERSLNRLWSIIEAARR
jgi:colanic acid/amylovoran biosynthesis glycosyltransferase